MEASLQKQAQPSLTEEQAGFQECENLLSTLWKQMDDDDEDSKQKYSLQINKLIGIFSKNNFAAFLRFSFIALVNATQYDFYGGRDAKNFKCSRNSEKLFLQRTFIKLLFNK